MRQLFAAPIVAACLALVGCTSGSTVPTEGNLTREEVQTYMREEAGIPLRLDREASDLPDVAVLVAKDFDLLVYADAVIDELRGDLWRPKPGTRDFGPWRSYESKILGDLGSRSVAVGFNRGLVLRYIVSTRKATRPRDVPDPDWYDEAVAKLGELTGTDTPLE